MSNPSLLLNASFEPLAVVSWQKALSLVFSEKVEIVHCYENQYVRSVNFSIKVPSVIRLIRYVRRHNTRIKFSRTNIYLRDRYQCQYCGSYSKVEILTLDHVVPKSQGGGTTWENITTACSPCNVKKGGRTPKEAEMPLLSIPYKPDKSMQLNINKNSNKTPEKWKIYLP
jgi:5-methylcytosine-specific restriction endonuclease McrA